MANLDKTVEYDFQHTPKLHTLQQAGINPFPDFSYDDERLPIAIVIDDHKNFKHHLKPGDNEAYPYVVMGRIIAKRGHGAVIFFDIEDAPGYVREEKIQIMVKRDIAPDLYEFASLLDIGDFVKVQGVLYLPPREELTIHAMNLQLLSKTVRPIPDKKEFSPGVTSSDVRYRHRELDLLGNTHVREIFRARAAIVREIRRYLDDEGYIEIEAPILQPLAGGSESQPFRTHYNSLHRDMVLSVSPELYINRTLIGGFERVYALTRSFRNEGISRRHNPEFTELEFMCAYIDNQTLAQEVEKLIQNVIKKCFTRNHPRLASNTLEKRLSDLCKPWRRFTFEELLYIRTGKLLHYMDSDKAMEIYTKEIEPTLIEPTFVFDFPIEAFPLCRQKEGQPHFADHFDGVINGIEVISADMELNDPVDQRRRFTEQAKNAGKDGPAPQDSEYIRALEHGLPPTAGAAIGIDRLVMLLTGQDTVREVIPFPMLKSTS